MRQNPPQRHIGDLTVSSLGLGCMGLSHAYGVPPPLEQAERVVLAAVDAGVTLFDTSPQYGNGGNETLLGRVLKPYRQRVTLITKCGLTTIKGNDGVMRRTVDGSPAAVRRDCEESLRRLQTDVIDHLCLHRQDANVPIEDTVGAMGDLVRAGKVRNIGLSEVSADTVRKAHAVHPLAGIQSEYSLWTRNPEIAVLRACRELGIAFVPYCPLARGFLAGAAIDITAFPPGDVRRANPRFQQPHYGENLKLMVPFKALAREAGCTPAQLALAWLLQLGEDIIPIPGTTHVKHLQENMGAAEVRLSADLVARLDALINQNTVSGPRYRLQSEGKIGSNLSELGTEEF